MRLMRVAKHSDSEDQTPVPGEQFYSKIPDGILMAPSKGNAELPQEIPDPVDIAAKVRGARSDLYVRILDRLAVQPGSRFTDLKSLLGDRNQNVLTKVLRRLQMEGLVEQRGFREEEAGYLLTWFGVVVRDEIVIHERFDEVSRALSREPSASSA